MGLVFVPVSKARTNKFYICQQCTYIIYVYTIHRTSCVFGDINMGHIFVLFIAYLPIVRS